MADKRPMVSAPTSKAQASSGASDEQLEAAMHGQLKALLDAVPGSRRVLQHMALLEHTLKQDGLRGLDWLPLAALEKANSQLASLPLKPESTMLPQLLSLLNLAIEARQAQHAPGSDQFLSSFLTDDKLLVSDASHTDFAQLQGNEEPLHLQLKP